MDPLSLEVAVEPRPRVKAEPVVVLRQGEPEPVALPPLARLTLLAALLLGSLARGYGFWNQVLTGDEVHAHGTVMKGYGFLLTHYDSDSNPLGASLLQRLALDLCGPSVLAYRLPFVLAGVLALFLSYPLARRIVGVGPAWFATLWLALHPLHVFYSRFARAYALVFLLGLVLCVCLVRALDGARRAWLGVALAAGLLPWMHLSAAGPVAVLGLATILWSARGSRAELGRACLAFGAGALLCLALFAPAWGSFSAGVSGLATQVGSRRFAPAAALALVSGSSLAGGAFVLVALAAGVALCRRRAGLGVVVLAGLLGTPLTLLLWRPVGDDFAYARYLLFALVPLLIGGAWGVFALARRPWPARPAAGFALGAVLLGGQLAAAPWPLSELDGAFRNHYPRMRPVAALERPFPATPALYRELAVAPGTLTLVEFPVTALATLLLDNYQRQHGQRVLAGSARHDPGVWTRPPYVSLAALEGGARADVDWVIVHKDLARELTEFLAQAGFPRSAVRLEGALVEGLPERFRRRWGAPAYEDGFVVAWRFEQ